MTTRAQVADFLDSFRSFAIGHEATRFAAFEQRFDLVQCGLTERRARVRESHRLAAPAFNVFTLLGVTRAEVTTHSAMLGELVDPDGSHGQGDRFLRSFLALKSINVGVADRDLRGLWHVAKEKVTAFGNLDLLLYSDVERTCVVVENKIDALDQPGQLARYYRWLRHSRYDLDRSRLLYLTPSGSAPNRDASLRDQNGILDVEAESKVQRLSYTDDLLAWLASCLDTCVAPRFVEVLRQYIDVVRAL